jgi:hypothetical protein
VASRADRSLIQAQLDATLSQLANVERVAISIERSSQEIDEQAGELRTSGARSLVVLGDSGLEAIGSSEADALAQGGDFFELNPATDIAISKQSSWLAALTATGVFRTSLVNPGVDVELVDSRSGILGIEFDRQDYLWSFTRARGSNVLATSSSGEQDRVLAPWLANQAVRGFSISPEGSRIAVLVASASRNVVLVSGIIRDRSGAPLELAPPIEIAAEVSNPNSLSWVDHVTVAVVNSSADFTSAVLVSVGGTSKIISALPNTRQLVAAGPAAQLYLLTRNSELHRFTGSSWVLVRSDTKALSVVN